MIYIFFYQFNYPFGATAFLYVAFALFVVWIVLGGGLYVSAQLIPAAAIAVVSAVGVLYTSNSEKGSREAILMAVTCVLLAAFSQNGLLLSKIRKTVCLLSFVVLIGVLVQFLFPDTVNAVLEKLLREDRFDELMRAYTSDNAYAGFSSLTSEASYFSALVLGYAAFDKVFSERSSTLSRVFGVIFIALSMFAVLLTSKRGVAVAMIIALLFSYMIKKRMSARTVLGVVALIVIGAGAIYALSFHNDSVRTFLMRFEVVDGHDITTGRTEIWQSAVKNLNNIFFGMGTGSAYDIYETGLHNIYLQILYDHGLLGLIVYLAFFAFNLFVAIRRRDSMSIFVQCLILTYGVSGNPIYSNSFFIAYIIFSATAANTICGDAERSEE